MMSVVGKCLDYRQSFADLLILLHERNLAAEPAPCLDDSDAVGIDVKQR